MKNSGKILRSGFWIILLGAIVIGYFKITDTSDTGHFKYIPNGVDGVAVFDGRRISKKFVERFRFNPAGLEEMIPEQIDEAEDIQLQKIGLDPYYKVAVFHFKIQDKNLVAALFKCEPRTFMKYFSDLHGNSLTDVYENSETGVKMKRFKSSLQDVSICAGPGIGIYCSTADGSALGSEYGEELIPFLTGAIENPEAGLLASNTSFSDFEDQHRDVGYWSVGVNQSFGALSDEFTDSKTYFSFEEGKVAIESELAFDGESPLKQEIRNLKSEAPFAFSFMADENSAWTFIEQNLPSRFHSYFTDFNGNFFFEITGHQLFQGYHVVDSVDEATFETYEVRVKNEQLTPFPEFLAVFSVNDPLAYNSVLDRDSNATCIAGFYEIEMIDGMKCYVSTNENNVCFSNSKKHVIAKAGKDLDALYATYGMRLDFIGLRENLPLSGDMGIGVPALFIHQGFGQLNFDAFQIDAVEITGNKVIGKGSFDFTDNELHSLDALIELANKGLAMKPVIEAILFQTDRKQNK